MTRPLFPRALARAAWMLLALFPAAALAADPNPPTLDSTRGAWPIRRQWTREEVRHHAEWITRIYEAKTAGTREQRLARIERVLTDPEMNLLLDPEFAGDGCNPQMEASALRAMHGILDCAKLTVALGTYYAYRRALPWMASGVRSGDGTDIRTAAFTVPAGVTSCLDYDTPENFLRDTLVGTCTGNFRVEPGRERSGLSDTVPVALTREHLLPGCLYYLDGHVLVLAKINPRGETLFLDATTSPTRDIYAFNGLNAVTGLTTAGGGDFAGCFRGFRAHRWPLAETDDKGRVTGVRRRTDAEMAEFGYSLEQYEKLDELKRTGKILVDGAEAGSFHQFLRLRLRTADRFRLRADLQAFAEEVAARLREREQRVQEARRDVAENGPVAFPEGSAAANVYTAHGRWGRLATALEDAELRGRYFELAEHLNNAVAWFEAHPGDFDLDGLNADAVWTAADLADALLRAKTEIFAGAAFEYANSAGQPVRLTLLDVEARLYDLSFDPNHPPELRWGAPAGSDEVRTADAGHPTPLPRGGAVPVDEAYRREAYYRSLYRWEPEESPLRGMFTEGFPRRDRLDADLAQKWFGVPSPPLVPSGGRAAWLAENGG